MTKPISAETIDAVRFDRDGLVPAIVQDSKTLEVLMLGFMNRQALETTLSTGHVTFWSRSRAKLWTKGETSGNMLHFLSLRMNCYADSLLILAEPTGATCHTGHPTCYFREAESHGWRLLSKPQFDPKNVYP
jgi:phosphoribosyl-AMP cyclohydrolase